MMKRRPLEVLTRRGEDIHSFREGYNDVKEIFRCPPHNGLERDYCEIFFNDGRSVIEYDVVTIFMSKPE